jgi:tetratricopeptide (TPR) repeat protein
MKELDNFNRIMAELKKCPANQVNKLASEATNIFPLLTKSEQLEITNEFLGWAEKMKANQPLKYAWSKFWDGWTDFLSERYESALTKTLEAKQIFTDLNEPGGIACSLVVMAGTYWTMGNSNLTLKLGMEAQRMLVPIGLFEHFLTASNYVLGIISFEMGIDTEAKKYLESALEQAQELKDDFWTCYILHGLGKLNLRKGNNDEALHYFDLAFREAEKNGKALAICNSLSELGNYYFQTGDYEASERNHKQALEIRLQNNFIGGAVTSYMRLGEILIKDSKHEEALDVITKGLALAEQIKVKPKICQAHLLLSQILEGKKEEASALEHYRQFHEIREQVDVEENARRLKNVQVVFEAEQAQKDNVVIRQQKAEIERKNAQLQETIDALTLARVSRKAKMFTLGIALILFIFEDTILHFALDLLNSDNYFASMAVKIGIIFSLKPISTGIEHYLMKEVVRKKKLNLSMNSAAVASA